MSAQPVRATTVFASAEAKPVESLAPLGTVVELESEARRADSVEKLGFVAVNQSHRAVKYNQAILWLLDANEVRIQAISGVSEFDHHSQAILFLNKLISRLHQGTDKAAIQQLTSSHAPENLRQGWEECLPEHVLWCPMVRPTGEQIGGLIFARDDRFLPADTKLITPLVEAYSHAWSALEPRASGLGGGVSGLVRRKGTKLCLIALAVASLALPVRESVLAPAEVVPFQPLVVSSPVKGVIDEFHVSSNQPVEVGQLLFTLDDTEFRSRYQIAEKRYSVARADHQRAVQKSFSDADSKAELELYKVRAEEKRLEREYARSLLERTQVRAERNGIAVFEDPNDWIGRPVEVGEKVLTLADPSQAEIQVWMAVEDAINLEPGSTVKFFLNTSPNSPLEARIRQTSYEPKKTPKGDFAFKLKAEFDQRADAPRIGLKGTAKVFGDDATLFYYIMRRPLSVLRQTIGW